MLDEKIKEECVSGVKSIDNEIIILDMATKMEIENHIQSAHKKKYGTIYITAPNNDRYQLLNFLQEKDCYDLHNKNGFVCMHATMSEIVEKLNDIKNEIKDKAVISILSKLSMEDKVCMTVNGQRNLYKIQKESDDSYEMVVVDSECKNTDKVTVYGMSCEGLADIVSVLLADYVRGIVSDIQIV